MAECIDRLPPCRWAFVGGIVVYSLLTLATGFSTSIGQVITLRFLAGPGMGAVFPWPYAWGCEPLPSRVRGRFTGLCDSFLSVGYFIAP
ncbi:MAG: MFS transporter [Acidimicrobiales bacterium]